MNGKELRLMRATLGMTQKQLGAALDIPVNTIARWEREEMPIEHGKLLWLAIDQLLLLKEEGRSADE